MSHVADVLGERVNTVPPAALRCYTLTLRLTAPVFVLVAALHLALGVGADALLGARLPAEVLQDATLNSQNRFYGVCFALYGVVLWIGSGDLARHRAMVAAAWWVFLAGGLSRVLSWGLDGAPSIWVAALSAVELLLPLPMLLWQRAALRDQG